MDNWEFSGWFKVASSILLALSLEQVATIFVRFLLLCSLVSYRPRINVYEFYVCSDSRTGSIRACMLRCCALWKILALETTAWLLLLWKVRPPALIINWNYWDSYNLCKVHTILLRSITFVDFPIRHNVPESHIPWVQSTLTIYCRAEVTWVSFHWFFSDCKGILLLMFY